MLKLIWRLRPDVLSEPKSVALFPSTERAQQADVGHFCGSTQNSSKKTWNLYIPHWLFRNQRDSTSACLLVQDPNRISVCYNVHLHPCPQVCYRFRLWWTWKKTNSLWHKGLLPYRCGVVFEVLHTLSTQVWNFKAFKVCLSSTSLFLHCFVFMFSLPSFSFLASVVCS